MIPDPGTILAAHAYLGRTRFPNAKTSFFGCKCGWETKDWGREAHAAHQLEMLADAGVAVVDVSAPLDVIETAAIALYGEQRPYKDWDNAPTSSQVETRREVMVVLRSVSLFPAAEKGTVQ